jgi:hypothetical protein
MSTQQKQMPEAEPQPPTCPHCKGALSEIRRYSWIAPPWLTLGIVCPHAECSALLHVQIVPVAALPAEEQDQSRPGRPRLIS